MLNHILLFCLFLVFLNACSNHEEMKKVFSREFPSEKKIKEDDIEYNMVNGYYFVKLKSKENFNLVCKKDAFSKKGCIHVWGDLSTDEFLEFDSLINNMYQSGFEVSMISKDSAFRYLVRVTKGDSYYKDIVFINSGTSLVTFSERNWQK